MNKVPSLKSQVPNKFQIPNVKIAGTEISRIWNLIIEGLFGIWGLGVEICSTKRLYLNREHRGQIAYDRFPFIACIYRGVNLAARGSEINAARLERIDRHRVA
jgi:hypothetical protein